MGVGLRGITVHRYRAQPTLCACTDQQIALDLPRPLKRTTGMGEITGHNKGVAASDLQRGRSAADGRSRIEMIKGNSASKRECPCGASATITSNESHRTIVMIKHSPRA